MAASCEHDNELSDPIIYDKLPKHFSDYQLLKKDPVPRCCL
jgi:hypothetical protein